MRRNILNKHSNSKYLVLVTGVLIVSSIWWEKTSYLAFIALVPYLLFLKHVYWCKKSHKVLLSTWLIGVFYGLASMSWLLTADTRAWTSLEGSGLRVFVFISWMIAGLTLSAGFLMLGAVTNYLLERATKFYIVLISFVLAWPLCEYIGSLFFSIVFYGKGGSLGPYYNFGNLGLMTTSTPLVYAGRLVGLFGLSLMVILCNVLIFLLIQKKYKYSIFLIICLTALSITGYRLYDENSNKHIRALSLQVAKQDVQGFDKVRTFIQNQNPQVDIAVLPEYFGPLETLNESNFNLAKNLLAPNGLAIYSKKFSNSDKTYNQLTYKNQQLQTVSSQNKSFIVPIGEYLPWITTTTLHLSGNDRTISDYNDTIRITKSEQKEQTVSGNYFRIGGMACSGILAPVLYSKMVNSGANILTNSASLDEFRDSKNFYSQTLHFAKVQAVVHNRTFVQSAQSGYGLIIDPNGNVQYMGKWHQTDISVKDVVLRTKITIYDRIGDWILIFSLLMLGGILSILRNKTIDIKHKK